MGIHISIAIKQPQNSTESENVIIKDTYLWEADRSQGINNSFHLPAIFSKVSLIVTKINVWCHLLKQTNKYFKSFYQEKTV